MDGDLQDELARLRSSIQNAQSSVERAREVLGVGAGHGQLGLRTLRK